MLNPLPFISIKTGDELQAKVSIVYGQLFAGCDGWNVLHE
jgi:hypothetical protein